MKVYYISEECGNGMSGQADRRIGKLYSNPDTALNSLLTGYVPVELKPEEIWIHDHYGVNYAYVYKPDMDHEDERYVILNHDCRDDCWCGKWNGYLKQIEIRSITVSYRHWTYYLREEEVID